MDKGIHKYKLHGKMAFHGGWHLHLHLHFALETGGERTEMRVVDQGTSEPGGKMGWGGRAEFPKKNNLLFDSPYRNVFVCVFIIILNDHERGFKHHSLTSNLFNSHQT